MRFELLCGRLERSTDFTRCLTNEWWSLIGPPLPRFDGRRGRVFRHNLRVIEDVVYCYRAAIACGKRPRVCSSADDLELSPLAGKRCPERIGTGPGENLAVHHGQPAVFRVSPGLPCLTDALQVCDSGEVAVDQLTRQR